MIFHYILSLLYIILLLAVIIVAFSMGVVYYCTGTFQISKLPEIYEIQKRSQVLKTVFYKKWLYFWL